MDKLVNRVKLLVEKLLVHSWPLSGAGVQLLKAGKMSYVSVTSYGGLLICVHSSHQASNKQEEEHNTTELWKQLGDVCGKSTLRKKK